MLNFFTVIYCTIFAVVIHSCVFTPLFFCFFVIFEIILSYVFVVFLA